jgi:hypothetical protein
MRRSTLAGMKRRAKTPGSHSSSFTLSGLTAGLTFLLATSCGGGPDGAAANAQIAKLLPDSTVAVVRIASLDELNKHRRTITADLGEADNGLDFVDMLTMSGLPLGDARLIDTSLPIVIAVTSKRATPPTVVAIVPTTDAAAHTQSLNEASVAITVDGNYIAIPVFGPYKRAETAPQILTKLRPGALSIHADLEPLTKTYKVFIDSGIELFEQQITHQMEMTNPNIDGEAIAQLYGSIGRAITGSAKTFNLAANYKDGMLDLDVALDVKPDSSMAGWSSPATDLKPLAQGMTGEGGLEAIFQFPMGKLMPRFHEILDSLGDVYPEEFQTVMRDLMTAYEPIYAQIESGAAIEGDLFGEEGIRMTAQMMPKNPEKYIGMITDLLRHDALKKMGLVAETPKTSVDGDTKITDIKIAIDFGKLLAVTGSGGTNQEQTSDAIKAMFGDGMAIRMAQRGDRVVMTWGKDRAAVAKATLEASEGSWSPGMQSAVARLEGCNPMFVERIDFARMMAAVFANMAKSGAPVPTVPKGANANMLFFGGINGNQWRGGLSVDIAGLGEQARLMSPR